MLVEVGPLKTSSDATDEQRSGSYDRLYDVDDLHCGKWVAPPESSLGIRSE